MINEVTGEKKDDETSAVIMQAMWRRQCPRRMSHQPNEMKIGADRVERSVERRQIGDGHAWRR